MDADAPADPACHLQELLASLGRAAVGAAIDLAPLDADALERLLTDVRVGQAALDALVVAIGVQADRLTDGGSSRPSHEFLLQRGRVRGNTARRDAARSAVCGAAPALGRALADGEVSGDHVDSIARGFGALDDDAKGRLDLDGLVADARRLPADTFDRVAKRAMAAAVSAGDDDGRLAESEAKRAASEFRHWFDRSAGMGRFSGSLDPERYEALTNAIENRVRALAAAASSSSAAADRTTHKNANLAATALTDLVSGGGSGGSGGGGSSGSGRVPSMTIVIDRTALEGCGDGGDARGRPEPLRQTEAGHDLTAEAVDRLLCDSALRRVLLDERSVPISVGRTRRVATDAQWAAIKAIHNTCAWTGCQRPIQWTQLHHIREWHRGGSTDLDNLVPLCSEHHHRVHEGRWSIRLLEDRSLQIRRPDRVIDSVNPPSRVRGDPTLESVP